jgi:predicted Zn finger-like uncharacterized protein
MYLDTETLGNAMKIVCDACSAKYSISDDKVQGKVFKIRCKKCSNIIVVRGNAGAAAPAEAAQHEKDTRVFDYGYDDSAGSEAVWHVVVDQDQVGPLSVADVQKRFRDGEIDAETYIWREGFADWLPINQVDAFAALFAGAGDSPPSHEDSGALFGHSSGEHRGGGAAVKDLFSAGSPAVDSSGGSSLDDDGDVFSARRPAVAPEAASQSKLRGERGENSVLFSLSNLAQLASDAPRPQASSSSSYTSTSGAAQHGGGEGSGLIDIRSMASAYLGPDKGSAKSASPVLGSSGDLPVFSSSGFGEPAVIVPIVRNNSGNNKLLYGLVALVGLLAVVAVVMVVFLLKGDKVPAAPQVAVAQPTDKTTAPESSTTPPPASGTTAGAAAGTAATPSAGTDPGAGSAATPPPPPPPEPTQPARGNDPKRNDKGSAKDPRDKKGNTSKGTTSSTPSKPAPEPEERPAKPEKPSSSDCDAVACLVDPSQPCCKKGGGAKPSSGGNNSSASKPDSSLPEQLDSSMIKAGIDRVKGRAQACGSKSSAKGSVKVKIKATPEGKVGSVDVVSAPDDALGSCVASALRGATFAKTQRGMGFAYTLTF